MRFVTLEILKTQLCCNLDFNNRMFAHERLIDSGSLAGGERVEVGYFGSGNLRLAKKAANGSGSQQPKYVPSGNVYSELDDMFKNGLALIMNAVSDVTGFHKSTVFAKATRNGNPERAMDFMMVN